MNTDFRKFASRDAALAALKAADAGLATTDKDGADHFATCGLDTSGARFDLIVTDVIAPTGNMIEGPQDGPPIPPMPEMAATGEVQVDLYWQGATAPVIDGGSPVDHAAIAFEPPMAPVAPPPIIPQFVTLFQGRTVMRGVKPGPNGSPSLFDAVDAYVEAHKADNPTLYDAWNYSNGFDRHGALVGALAPQFGISDAELDAMFIAGSAIKG